VITVEDWAEIRRLYRAEKVPIKEIVRRLGVARNTVRAALASDLPPKYERPARGSLVDAVEIEVRKLLKDFPRMPATVIAERIGWEHSMTILKDRLKVIRPEYAGIDPADRIVHVPGATTQCDLWFPETRIPVGYAQTAMLPVLAMTLTYSRFISAVMLPSRQAGDLLAGMWQLIAALGAVSRTLVWDRESAIGGSGRVSTPAAMFAGTLGTRIRLLPPRDPESKGVVERNNGFFETSFLPGRSFAGPGDFNDQLSAWLPRANTRLVRATGARPVDALGVDLKAMSVLPPLAPVVGLANRVRLARDYYVRVDTNDYSVDPRMIGRLVDVTASPTKVLVTCEGMIVAEHARTWARRVVITDPAHVRAARTLRAAFGLERAARERAAVQGGRRHVDGTPVPLRALPDYDTLFGVDFTAVGAGRMGLDADIQADTDTNVGVGVNAISDGAAGGAGLDLDATAATAVVVLPAPEVSA
jgi:transposase